jgi:SagB-type dehydrogenase family enzyme
MRVRSAQTLVFSRQAREIVAFNFLTNSAFACSHDLLAFLTAVDEWTDLDEVCSQIPAMRPDEVRTTVKDLIGVHALTEEHSPQAEAEDEFRTNWRWGVPAAVFHFSLRDKEQMSLEQTEALQRTRISEESQPPLYLTNEWANGSAVRLPPALDDNELLQLMARRRTVRTAAASDISLRQLSDCLFAGCGITGKTTNCVGVLPLGMTPSGGARNPYEAYVYARSVEGLDPGFYHYSAADHTLARLGTNEMPLPSSLLNGQEWADEMPCVIILMAMLERTMWKYDDANAYRVVLIEAGHIGQNIMLAATQHGLSACPTAALCHSELTRCIAPDAKLTQTPVYALTLAKPGAQA